MNRIFVMEELSEIPYPNFLLEGMNLHINFWENALVDFKILEIQDLNPIPKMGFDEWY